MRNLIVTAVVAIGVLAFAPAALALESGSTCDDEDYTVSQTTVDSATPVPTQPQAPTS